MAQIVEMTCEEFTGSFGAGKGGLEVSGHPADRSLPGSLFFLLFCCTDRQDLSFVGISPLPPPHLFIILFKDGSSISVPDSSVSRVHRDQLSSRLAFSTSNQCYSI